MNSPDALSLSYNGGKDCLVLLVLYLSALHSYSINRPSSKSSECPSVSSTNSPKRPLPETLQSVYIIPSDPFPEVDTFVAHSSKEYHLSLTRSTAPMKEAFSTYLASAPSVRAIFVGTRRTDPHGGSLTFFDQTDRGWPAFMRVHPVIDWHYAEVWAFIRELDVEYCPLYDQGYTSLGGTRDTLPNPALKERGGDGHRPAYELVEDEEERLGRDR